MATFTGNPNAFPVMRDAIYRGLLRHTEMIANGAPFVDTNAQLRSVVNDVCGPMLQGLLSTTDPYAAHIQRGISNQFCVSVRPRFEEEASGYQGFAKWVALNFSTIQPIDYNDVPWSGTFVNLFGYDNSLQMKYAAVVTDATCSNWWQQMGIYECTA